MRVRPGPDAVAVVGTVVTGGDPTGAGWTGPDATDGLRSLGRHAVVIDGERIVDVIPAKVAASRWPELARDDHGDRLVTPGFVDAHVHLGQTGRVAGALDLHAADSLADLLDLVRDRAAAQPTGILVGHGWDDTRWGVDARPPTATDLTAAVPGRAVYLARVDAHSALVSDELAAGVPGIREADGYLGDGRVARDAHHAVRDIVNGSRRRDERRADLVTALRGAAALGLVAVHELGAPHLSDPDDLRLLTELDDGSLPAVTGYWGEHADTGGIDRARELGCAGAAGDLSADGAIGSRTAALLQPYTDEPGTRGSLYLDATAVAAHVRAATLAGMPAGFHCIGDAGVRAVLAGFARVVDELGVDAVRACRHRLEHLELWPGPPDAVARAAQALAAWGVVASMQPAFDAWWGGSGGLYERRLGHDRAVTMNPLRILQDAGVALALGSDSPVTPMHPWAGVAAAVGHHNVGQQLSTAQAFAAHTVGGWAATGRDEAGRGSLVPGGYADLAVWSTAGVEAAIGAPDAVSCVLSVRAGRVLYDARTGSSAGA